MPLAHAKVCLSCSRVPTQDAYDATYCNHCGGRVFTTELVDLPDWHEYYNRDEAAIPNRMEKTNAR